MERPPRSTQPIINTSGMLGSSASIGFRKLIEDSMRDVDQRFENIEKQITTLTKKFDNLQEFAGELTVKYRARAAQVGGTFNRKEILQVILDHRLDNRDIHLLCRIIDLVFEYILGRLRRNTQCDFELTSITDVHKLQMRDKQFGDIYDSVAAELGFSNSNKKDSTIFQLYSFRRDFAFVLDNSNNREHSLMNEDDQEEESDPSGKNHSIFFLPLESSQIQKYALGKIKSGVDNQNLAEALNTCINILTKMSSDKAASHCTEV